LENKRMRRGGITKVFVHHTVYITHSIAGCTQPGA
jgi:hypothetical protein